MNKTGNHHLRHAAIYLAARGGPGLIAFFAIPLFSRLLTPTEYGRYAVVIAIVATINAALFQWLRLSLVRFMPAAGEGHGGLKSTLLATSLALLAALALIGGVAALLPGAAGWRDAILATWVLTAAQVFFDLSCEYARAVMRPWRYMCLQLARTMLWLGVGAALIGLGWSWYAPVAGLAIAMGVACAAFSAGDWREARLAIDPALLSRLFRYGVPISITVLLAILLTSIDRWMIVAYHGEAAAGGYAVAVDFTLQTITLLMMTVNLAVFPAAVAAWTRDGHDAAMEHLSSNASLLLAVGVPGAAGVAVLAPGLAYCLLGAGFRDAAVPLMPLVALASLLAGLKAYHFDAAFQLTHRTGQQVAIAVGVGIANVGLNFLLIPKWGPMGAAVSVLASYAAMLAISAWASRRLVAMPFALGSTWRVLLATATMSAILWPTRSITSPAVVAAQVVVGGLAYAAVLVATDFLGCRGALLRRLRPDSATRAPAGADFLSPTAADAALDL